MFHLSFVLICFLDYGPVLSDVAMVNSALCQISFTSFRRARLMSIFIEFQVGLSFMVLGFELVSLIAWLRVSLVIVSAASLLVSVFSASAFPAHYDQVGHACLVGDCVLDKFALVTAFGMCMVCHLVLNLPCLITKNIAMSRLLALYPLNYVVTYAVTVYLYFEPTGRRQPLLMSIASILESLGGFLNCAVYLLVYRSAKQCFGKTRTCQSSGSVVTELFELHELEISDIESAFQTNEEVSPAYLANF